MSKVLILNDDETPMEFVVDVLERVFDKNRDDAVRIMPRVHQKGVGVCGVYADDVAEAKVAEVKILAREKRHPLMFTTEKE